MSRQPFITADLRPDLTVESNPALPKLTEHAPVAQLAEVARAVLSEEEHFQVERGDPDKQRQLMAAVPCPNPNVQGTTLEGETVLLDLSTGRYYTLNRIGTAIWERCTGSQSLRGIHASLCAKYEAASDRISDDLLALVTHLSHEGLLTLERR
ncbi:MAG TPA: PqqD family protein [Nitrospiraceae bacterium]|nr:PqqD family protein [Nitrospiraceae bacterium]